MKLLLVVSILFLGSSSAHATYEGNPVHVQVGGTGDSSLTQYGVMLGDGTGPVSVLSPVSSTAFPIVSGGTTANPSWSLLSVAGGGTGLSTNTAYSIFAGGTTSTAAHQQLGTATAGYTLQGNGGSALPTWVPPSYVGNIIAAYGMTTGYTPSSNTAIKYDTLIVDTNSAYNTSNGLFTCPVTGNYTINAVGNINSGSTDFYIVVNGSAGAPGGYLFTVTSGGSGGVGGSMVVPCTATQTLAVYQDSAHTFTNVGATGYANWVSFSLAPGNGGSGFLPMSSGNLSAVSANEIVGSGYTARAISVQNLTATATSFTCVSNPTFTLLDCGTSAGSCTSGTTTIGTVTVTAANTITAGTISSPNIASGHFWAWEITSGTCTVLDANGSAGL